MAKQKIGIIGSGMVAQSLAAGFLKYGWEVRLGTRSPEKLSAWTSKPGFSIGSFADAAKYGELILLAVKGTVAEAALKQAGIDNLNAKTILDACNPIADAPPQDGVLQYFTGPNESLLERLQKLASKANFVKAFSCIGSALMVDPKLPGGKPSMFICGNDAGAKKQASAIIEKFGFEVEDMGTAAAARAIEPLAMLWCIPGFKSNDWMHAFKVLRP